MKKVFYLFITLCFITLIYSTSSLATDNINLIKIDVQTGDITPCPVASSETTLSTLSFQATPSTRDVFASDTREQVTDTTKFPYSTVCRIEGVNNYDNTSIISTATMIGPKVAITAAHSVYQSNLGGLFNNITVSPRYYRGNKPFGSSVVKTIYLAQEWLDTNGSSDLTTLNSSFDYDWAVVVLNDKIGNNSGWLSVRRYSNYLDLFGLNAKIIGYPHKIERDNFYANYFFQYMATGKIDTAFGKILEYTIDTSDGQSGAALLNTTNEVVGIHGGTTLNRLSNRGVKIDEFIMSQIVEALNEL